MSLKTITLFFAAMLVPAATVAQVIPSEVDWIRQFGGEGPSNDELNAVAVDGGIYVAGNSSGSLPDDTAVFGVFLRRYDANGAVAWTRQFGTSGTQAVLGVAAAADAVYVVGVTRDPIDGQATFGDSDGFVCRFTAEGDQRWCRIVGTPEFDDTASAVADATGVYIAGYTWGTLAGQTKNGAFTDAYIQKYDTDGNTVWTRQFGSSDVTRAEAIAADGVALYVAGAVRGSLGGQAPAGATDVFVRSYDMSGNELWTRQFGSSESDSAARIAVSAGRVYVAAVTFGALPGQVSLGATDVFVRAYDSSGLELWTRQFGTETSDAIGGVAADWAGVYAAGSTFGTLPGRTSIGMQDAFLRRYDASGNELWTRQFGHDLSDNANGVGVDASGVYVAGRREVPLFGTATIDDAIVWKYDAFGNPVWQRQFGGVGHGVDFADSVALRQGVYVVGRADRDLPGQTRVGGGSDAFVRKYDDQGSELWTRQFGTTNSEDATGVAVDDTGVYIVGNTFGTFPGHSRTPGGANAFVRKYDHTGQELWTRQYGMVELADEITDAAVADGTGVYITGRAMLFLPDRMETLQVHVRKYDVNGNELWTRAFDVSGAGAASGIAFDATGVYIAGGVSGALPGQVHLGSSDAFVRKFDTAGTEQWTRQFGTSFADGAADVAVHGGIVYVAGSTPGTLAAAVPGGVVDGFVRAYDTAGAKLWTRQFSTAPDSSSRAVAADASGVYVGSRSGQFFALDTFDIFVHKFSTSGTLLWLRRLATPLMDEAMSLAVDGTGIYLAGMTDGLFVDQRPGFTDALVVKLLNPVSIDVLPGDPLNAINPRSRLLTVAILSDLQFDAARVDSRTVCIGDASLPASRGCTEVHGRGHIADVNSDGRGDMVLHYELQTTGVNQTTVEACLVGATLESVPFKGCDAVSAR